MRPARQALVIACLLVAACEPAPQLAAVPPLTAGRPPEAAVARQLEEQHERVNRDASAAAWLRLGQLYQAYRYFEQALAAYGNALQLDPGNSEALFYQGYVARRMGRTQLAQEALGAVLARDPADLTTRLELVELELDRGNSRAAQRLLEAVDAASRSHPWVRSALGRLALEQGDFTAAAEHFTAALVTSPRSAELHHGLVQALRGAGRLDEARQHLRAAAASGYTPRDPGNDDPRIARVLAMQRGSLALEARADELLRAGRTDEGLRLLQEAVVTDPDHADLHFNLALALQRSGRISQAADELGSLLRRHPRYVPGLVTLAQLLARRGEDDEALRLLERAVRVDSQDVRARLALADLHAARQRIPAAVEELQQAVSIDPQFEIAQLRLASLRWHAGQAPEAVAALEAALAANPRNPRFPALLARLLTRPPVADPQRAASLIAPWRNARDLPPGLAETVAMVLAAGGDFADAVRFQNMALAALPPGHPQQRLAATRLETLRGGQLITDVWAARERLLLGNN
ncbi:MAG: tetratricopeptide repeat protein [Gammaproteobacteria bacterium]|nr:tetratricopeptide repeat protein [Gammaproteobacteria bacterium]